MKTLRDLLKESLLDDEEKILDKFDKDTEYNYWLNGLSNKNSFGGYFSKLWTEINKNSKEVKPSHVGGEKYYIAFITSWNFDIRCESIRIAIPQKQERFTYIDLRCVKHDNGNVIRLTCSKLNRPLKSSDIFSRKSKSNPFLGRQIYEVPQEYMFLIKLFEELYEKID